MAPPLNLNAKNLPNTDFFLGILNLCIFFWASASKQLKTSAKNSTVRKEEGNKILFRTFIYLSVALGLTIVCIFVFQNPAKAQMTIFQTLVYV